MSFAQHVWETLSNIDVSDHTDFQPATIDKETGRVKRPEVEYLPWHKAWLLVKRAFPGTSVKNGAVTIHPDQTVEVDVTVYISNKANAPDADEVVIASATLPVMDFWFNAIKNPDARAINDARQRCRVKALAEQGLGLNLWSQSNIPVGKLDDPITSKQRGIIMDLLEETSTDLEFFLEWAGVESVTDLPTEKFASARRLLESKKEKK
jgi:hypothetical protein